MLSQEELTSSTCWSSKCLLISKYILSYCFYIHIILIISIAIVQLRFSIVYQNHCTIDHRIILYLFIIGIIEIIYSLNGILLIIFSLLYHKYRCFIPLLLTCCVVHQILIIFLIIWFIVGNYSVFHVINKVQFINSYSITTYCNYTLYQTAFWTIIAHYILLVLFSIVLTIINRKWFLKIFQHFKN